MGSMFKFFLLFILIGSCIEPYEFIVRQRASTLVVEGFISDKSFSETLSYPSDGRYFTIKLSSTSDVTNSRPVMVAGASVQLINDLNEGWNYTESGIKEGIYELLDDEFSAQKGVKYKIKISLSDNETFESSWEALPATEPLPMGDISFNEVEIQRFVVEASETVVKTIRGITTNITVPAMSEDPQGFHRYEFTPQWIYAAPLIPPSSSIGTCWVTDVNYIADYVLQTDNGAGYKKDLFFVETIRNERIFVDFSVLINQYSLTEDQFQFWKEMQQQAIGGIVFDTPPFNLKTNILSTSGDEGVVSGYFGVVGEQAKRWYFNKEDLSYNVQNTLRGDCLVDYGPGPPAAECTDCREYSFGVATTEKPAWWRN